MSRPPAALVGLLFAAGVLSADEADKGLKSIRAADIRRHQEVLASDAMRGREAGSDEGHKTAVYLMEQARALQLQPGGVRGGYFQPFGPGALEGTIEEANVLAVDAAAFKLNAGLLLHRESKPGTAIAPVVFAGYGIKDKAYDDYSVAKVKDAIALVLDHGPREKKEGKLVATFHQKVRWAEEQGARAILFALDPVNHEDRDAVPFELFTWPPPKDHLEPKYSIPVAYVSRDAAEAIAKAAGKDLRASQVEIDRALKPVTWRTPRAVTLLVSTSLPPGKGTKNVIAVWPGRDEKLKKEFVVLGAHYDHVGLGFTGSNKGKPGEVHNGADDNASGSATLLELAEAAAHCAFKRTLVFMWFDAEERSLEGSQYWARDPTLDPASCIAMINLDMIGRNAPGQIICGVKKDAQGKPAFPKWVDAVQEVERRHAVTFDWTSFDTFIQRSDHWPFMELGVPAIFFTTGLHADYHKETDDIEKIDFAKEERIARMIFALAAKAADSPEGYR